MVYTAAISIVLVVVTVMLHAAALSAIASALINRASTSLFTVATAICLVMLAHFTEVILFAAGFYIAIENAGVGTLKGEFSGHIQEYLYFSLVSYTSLGLGDVYPYGPIRLLTGIEALTGLVMIGWSASFTYICMTKSWMAEKP